jgi:hypothetical protein
MIATRLPAGRQGSLPISQPKEGIRKICLRRGNTEPHLWVEREERNKFLEMEALPKLSQAIREIESRAAREDSVHTSVSCLSRTLSTWVCLS